MYDVSPSYINDFYYHLRPFIPRKLQITLRREFVVRKLLNHLHNWPIEPKASQKPKNWPGWPEGKRFALILTHDVDTAKGHSRCKQLMEIEKHFHMKSSFNFVPERYSVSSKLRDYITEQGFEIGVHGLCHDGKLYKSLDTFKSRAEKINNYLKEWNAVGFRSPAMHHNLDWIHLLNIEYDASTFDTDPFEPQSYGMETIFPFYISNGATKGYIELPYTLPQDFTLFVLMRQKNINLWITKLEWIIQNKGMALINVHPDYTCFNHKCSFSEYSYKYYLKLLQYIYTNYKDEYWNPLPKELAVWFSDQYVHTQDT